MAARYRVSAVSMVGFEKYFRSHFTTALAPSTDGSPGPVETKGGGRPWPRGEKIEGVLVVALDQEHDEIESGPDGELGLGTKSFAELMADPQIRIVPDKSDLQQQQDALDRQRAEIDAEVERRVAARLAAGASGSAGTSTASGAGAGGGAAGAGGEQQPPGGSKPPKSK